MRAEALYGADLVSSPPALLHVAAVWRRPDGALANLAIGPTTPESDTDAFVLALARARADAIVTTGRCLRDEPGLVHSLGRMGDALTAWRRVRLGRADPPLSVVLTRGHDIDLAHPLFRSAPRSLVFTAADPARSLARRTRASSIEIVAHPAPGLPALVEHLRGRLGPRATILIEAGPSTASALYPARADGAGSVHGGAPPPPRPGAPLVVDELLLSLCLAEAIDGAAIGGGFPSEATIAAAGLACVCERACEEASGRWLFRRYRVVSDA